MMQLKLHNMVIFFINLSIISFLFVCPVSIIIILTQAMMMKKANLRDKRKLLLILDVLLPYIFWQTFANCCKYVSKTMSLFALWIINAQ